MLYIAMTNQISIGIFKHYELLNFHLFNQFALDMFHVQLLMH